MSKKYIFRCDFDCFKCKFKDCKNGSHPPRKEEMKAIREALEK